MLSTKPEKPKQIANQAALKIYLACLLAIVFFSAVGSLVQRIIVRYERSSGKRIQLNWTRSFDSAISLPKQSWHTFPLVGIFIAINTILLFTPAIYYAPSYFASRVGWLATANFILCAFLGLKNTVLRFFLPTSYHKLYFFHLVVGYTAIAQVVLHGIFYTIHFALKNKFWTLFNAGGNREGLYAGAGILFLLLGLMKRWRYGFFYFSHIVGFVIMKFFLGLHRPEWRQHLLRLVFALAGMWCVDRAIRAAQVAFNLINNEARLYPLAGGGVRLVLKKPLPVASPGLHCFVWIPGIRPLKTHPFTILSNSNSGLELVFKSYHGFTKELYKSAAVNPGLAVYASAHGPYGTLPDVSLYDKIVMISGGTGASFTFGLTRRLLDLNQKPFPPPVHFIWAVRTSDELAWYTNELVSLISNATNIAFTLRVTREKPSEDLTHLFTAFRQALEHQRTAKADISFEATPLLCGLEQNDNNQNAQEADMWETIRTRGSFKFEKLGIRREIQESIQDLGHDKRVLIAVCGPRSLVDAVKNSTAASDKPLGPNIDLVCEHLDW